MFDDATASASDIELLGQQARDIWSVAQGSYWLPVLMVSLTLLGLLLFLTRPRRKRACRWKIDQRRRAGQLDRWLCLTCGQDAFTSDCKPPKDCKRHLREAKL